MKKTDEELLLLIAKDDREAFAELYRRHSQRVFSYAFKRLNSQALAEEATQTIFWQIFNKREKYDPQYAALQWIYVISRSEIKDLRNREKRFEHDSLEDNKKTESSLSQKDSSLPIFESEEEVDRLLAVLPEESRKVLELRYLKELSFEEIARLSGKNAANLRQMVHRALKTLKGLKGKES